MIWVILIIIAVIVLVPVFWWISTSNRFKRMEVKSSMKRITLLFLSLALMVSLAACGNNTPAPSESDISTPSVSNASSQQTSSPTQSEKNLAPERITGTLYAVFSENDVREMDFGYEEGACTPEKIAAALSEWTGLDFNMTVELDTQYNTVIIDWSADSAMATGQPPETQKEEFHFYDEEQLRFFMLNSLCRTIRENMGKLDVFYSLGGNGDNMNDLGLDLDFNPAIAYNKMEDSRVLG